jgi:hypothetical protein
MGGSPAKVRQILDRINQAMIDTGAEIRSYIKEHSEFAEIGERMLEEWEKGAALSLRLAS